MSKFEYYPNYSDPRFYEKIVKKKEFYINKIPKDRKTEMENCDTSKKFELLPQQSFLKNFINKMDSNFLIHQRHASYAMSDETTNRVLLGDIYHG
jgi:hypothetical protein